MTGFSMTIVRPGAGTVFLSGVASARGVARRVDFFLSPAVFLRLGVVFARFLESRSFFPTSFFFGIGFFFGVGFLLGTGLFFETGFFFAPSCLFSTTFRLGAVFFFGAAFFFGRALRLGALFVLAMDFFAAPARFVWPASRFFVFRAAAELVVLARPDMGRVFFFDACSFDWRRAAVRLDPDVRFVFDGVPLRSVRRRFEVSDRLPDLRLDFAI